MIANKCENYTEQFTGYGNQSLYLRHPFLKMTLILPMQYSAFADDIYRGKKQEFSQKRPPPLRYAPVPFVLAGANLEKVQSGMFEHLGYCSIFSEISHLPNKPGCRNLTNPLQRKNKTTVGNFLKMLAHVFLELTGESLNVFYGRNNLLDLKNNTILAFYNSYRFRSRMIQFLSAFSTQSSPAYLLKYLCQKLYARFHNIMRSRIVLQKILSAFDGDILHDRHKLRKDKKNQILKLAHKHTHSLYASFSGLSQPAQFRHRAFRNYHSERMSKPYDIGNNLGVFLVCLVRGITLQFFQSLRMPGIYLHKTHIVPPQKVQQWFRIRTCGFKSHYYFRKVTESLSPAHLLPHLFKAPPTVTELKSFPISTIRKPVISCMFYL